MTLKLISSQTQVHPSQRTDPPSKAHCIQPRNTACWHMACPAHQPEAYALFGAGHKVFQP